MRVIKQIFIMLFVFGGLQLNGQASYSTPEITSLSVDPVTGKIVLKWNSPNPAHSVFAHEISGKTYTSANYFFVPSATVAMPDTVLIETLPDVKTQRYGYRILSKNGSDQFNISDMHITMQFSGNYNQCTNTVSLNWTEYKRYAIDENGQIDPYNVEALKFNNAIEYEVWGHSGSVFNLSSAVKMTEKSNRHTNISLDTLTSGTTYFLFVKALLPNGDTATTYRLAVETTGKRLPSVMNIDTVASESGMIHLHLNIAKNTDIDTFAIYRVGTRIPLVWYYSAAEIPARFTDRTVSIGQVYQYNIVGFLCGKPMLVSDTVSNILLYATPSNLNSAIRWTEFFNESNPVTYNLHVTYPSKIELDPGNSLFFLDTSTHDSVCFGPQKFCYVMTAQTATSFARSEEACASLNSVITMPDAINPLSGISASKECNCDTDCTNHRRLFGPVMDINNDAYCLEIEIYDRSGVRLFRSKKNFHETLQKEYHYWDGKYNGRYVNSGVYVYFTKIEFRKASPVTMRGSVTVVTQNSN